MADRLADNRGTPYNPNKEFWGQGLIQTFVPMLNGLPLSGALARTATNIEVGAVTPLAGIMKCFLKLTLVWLLAHYLELVPMACIGGILMWVAFNMVKPIEIKQVWTHSWFHAALMIYTALMVIFTKPGEAFSKGMKRTYSFWIVQLSMKSQSNSTPMPGCRGGCAYPWASISRRFFMPNSM
jgi:MFS superfamily sulfate permease-like transporter